MENQAEKMQLLLKERVQKQDLQEIGDKFHELNEAHT